MAAGRFSKLESTTGVPAANSAPGEAPHAPPPAAPTVDDYPTFLTKADELFFTGQYREALVFYSRALQQQNAQAYPWIGQISALIELKQYREADVWSGRALEQFPEDPSLLSQRARVLAVTGNIKRAIGASDYAMTRGSTTWAWLCRGEVLLAAGDANANFCFGKAMELAGPEDWRTPLVAGLAFARRRQWANAEDYLRRSAERNSHNYFTWFELAKVLKELSYTDRALDAIRRVRQLKPDFKEALNLESSIHTRPFYERLLGFIKR